MADEKEGATNYTRCKLYRLGDGDWVPVGVGHAWVDVKENGGGRLVLVDEDDPRKLLVTHTIEPSSPHYQKQQDTLILFTNTQTQEEFGLSFEKAEGCREVWKLLSMARQPIGGDQGDLSRVEAQEDTRIPIPPAELAELGNLAGFLESFFTPDGSRLLPMRDRVAQTLLQENYLEKIFDLFCQAEELEDIESLHFIWRIVRALLLLNSTEMTKELLSLKNLRSVIGCFEYNPNRPGRKCNHRAFLDKTRFCNPLKLDKLAEKIQQIYMVQYLKETVVGAVLDDSTFEALHMYLLVNRNDVLRSIACDEDHMNEVFRALTDCKEDELLREQLLLFLQDMVTSAKSLPPQHRLDFFDFLVRRGIFRTLTSFIVHPSPKLRLATADIIWQIANVDVNHLRNFCLDEQERSEGCPFLRMMFEQFVREDVEGLQHQLQDIIRLLVETQAQKAQYAIAGGPQPPEMPPGFVNLLYEPLPAARPPSQQQRPLIESLFRPVQYHPLHSAEEDIPAPHKWLRSTPSRADSVLYMVLPILASCVAGHSTRMNALLLNTNMPKKVIALFNNPSSKHLQLSIVWFVKALIASNDEMMYRYMVQHDLLGPFLEKLKSSKGYNLLNSSLLSMLEYMWRENCKTLLKYVVEKYREVLNGVDYVEVGKMVLKRHEQNVDRSMQLSHAAANESRVHKPTASGNPFHSKLQEDDDDYFDRDDDDDEDSNNPLRVVQGYMEEENRAKRRKLDDDMATD